MINGEVRKVEDDIIKLLNGSALCVEIKRLIISDILSKISNEANIAIVMELKQEENNAESV